MTGGDASKSRSGPDGISPDARPCAFTIDTWQPKVKHGEIAQLLDGIERFPRDPACPGEVGPLLLSGGPAAKSPPVVGSTGTIQFGLEEFTARVQ